MMKSFFRGLPRRAASFISALGLAAGCGGGLSGCEDEPSKDLPSDVAFVEIADQGNKYGNVENYVVVTNRNFDSITKIRLSDFDIRTTYVGPRPAKLFISPNGSQALVFSDLAERNGFSLVDLVNDATIADYELAYNRSAAAFSQNTRVAFSPDGSLALIQSYPAAVVYALDLRSGEIWSGGNANLVAQDVYINNDNIAYFIMPGGGVNVARADLNAHTFQTLFNTADEVGWRNDIYYAFDKVDNRLLAIDVKNDKTEPIAVGDGAYSVAASADLSRILVGRVIEGEELHALALYEPDTGELFTDIVARVAPVELMVAPGGAWAAVVDPHYYQIEAVDLNTRKSLGRYPVSSNSSGDSLALDEKQMAISDGRALLVDLRGARLVSFDLAGETVSAKLLSGYPTSLAFSPDGGLALYTTTQTITDDKLKLWRAGFDESGLTSEELQTTVDFDYFAFTKDGAKAYTRKYSLDPEYDSSIAEPCRPQWRIEGQAQPITDSVGDIDIVAFDAIIVSECAPRPSEPMANFEIVDLQTNEVTPLHLANTIVYQRVIPAMDLMVYIEEVEVTEPADNNTGIDVTVIIDDDDEKTTTKQYAGVVNFNRPDLGVVRAPGEKPRGFFPTPDGSRLYITMNETDSVARFDVATLGTIEIESGIGPQSVAFSPEGRYAFISHGHPLGTLTIYDSIRNAIVKQAVGAAAYGILDRY